MRQEKRTQHCFRSLQGFFCLLLSVIELNHLIYSDSVGYSQT